MDLGEAVAARLGVGYVDELGGGHQSRVFRFTHASGVDAVAKAWVRPSSDRGSIVVRVAAAASVARLCDAVCRPLPLDGVLVVDLSGLSGRDGYTRGHLACFEMASGRQPDPARSDDATAMGVGLAELHRAMRSVDLSARLPLTSAPPGGPGPVLAPGNTEAGAGADAVQLLHGDFHPGNLRLDGDRLRIFDLDDCGHGPPSFDVANALYMVMFDSVTQGREAVYEQFRPAFVAGYEQTSGAVLADGVLDRHIDRRVDTLRRWLADLATAPAGIQSSSEEWRATLHRFVQRTNGSRAGERWGSDPD